MKNIIKQNNLKYLITFICLIGILQISAQSLSIKEKYDSEKDMYNYYNYTDGNVITNPNGLGDGLSYILESLLQMYKTTGDKSYLIKLVNHIIQIQEIRGIYDFNKDSCGGYTVISPLAFSPCVYQNGLILWPMAHFVYLVKIEENDILYDLPLYQTGKILNNNFNLNFNTFGEFADWLQNRVHESMIYFVMAYWITDNNYGFRQPKNHGLDMEVRPFALNKQSCMGVSLYYLGRSYQNSSSELSLIFLSKAARLAELFKTTREEKRPNYLNLCWPPEVFNIDVLENYNNSYIWKYNGWRDYTCNEFNEDKVYYDNISHGAQTMIFPLAINNELSLNNIMLFDDSDMLKFRNTFTKIVFANQYSENCPDIHVSVNGSDRNEEYTDPTYSVLNYYRIRSFSWMPLYKFDDLGSSPNVYDIVMDVYSNNQCWGGDIYTGADYCGLSHIVTAQWDKECPDLTLYNRKVEYDQNFFAKHNLTIDPAADNSVNLNNESFADPVIYTDEFTIEPNTVVEMKAGNKIVLKPGFHAKAGSKVHGFIDQSLCTGSYTNKGMLTDNSYSNNDDADFENITTDKNSINSNEQNINKKEISFKIFPNPNNGRFILKISDYNDAPYNLKITDVLGNSIYSQSNIISQEYEINISDKSKGLYVIYLNYKENVFKEVIIIN
ncbi:MAG: 3-coathanger stack domain-containing protein [Bacteroidota bacterium]